MVDVTPKEPTHRRAVARAKVFMQPETTAAIANREVKKGDVLAVARVAAIQAAKRTSDMIPLCHPLLVGSVSVNFEIGDDHIEIEVQVDTVDRTGVEMEALHACSVAALTIYDMCKSADRGMVIGEMALWEKTGRVPKMADAMIRLFYTAHTNGHEQVKNIVTALNESERFTVTLSETAKGWQASTEATTKPARTSTRITPRAKRAKVAA